MCQAPLASARPLALSRLRAGRSPTRFPPPLSAPALLLGCNRSRGRCCGDAWRVPQRTLTYLPLGTCWPPCLRCAPSFFCRRAGKGRSAPSPRCRCCPLRHPPRAQQGARQLRRRYGQAAGREGGGGEGKQESGSRRRVKATRRARLAGLGAEAELL